MTTELKTAPKFLAYDGDCPMCIATVGLLVRRRLVREDQTRANYDLQGEDLAAAQQAGIRNQLVVIDPASREVRVGSDGLLWIIADTPGFAPLARCLRLPVLRHLVNFGYQAISYNRRILSPPAHQIVCDCEPEVTVGRRLTLIVPLLIMAALIQAGFGAAVFVGSELGSGSTGAALMSVAALCGWTFVALAGFAILGAARGLDYLGHLTVTMFAGALILLPGAVVLAWLPPPVAWAATGLSLLFCLSTMFKMQRRRVKALQLSPAWLWGWSVTLVGVFGAVVAGYFRGQLF